MTAATTPDERQTALPCPNSRDDVKSYPAEPPLSKVPDHNSCGTAATFFQRHPGRNASPTVWAYASISCHGILRRNGDASVRTCYQLWGRTCS